VTGPQGEATLATHNNVALPPVPQEDNDITTEATAIDHAPVDTPEIAKIQASEETTTPIVEPKRGRGRPRKRPVVVDKKVMDEPLRLRGGKEIGGRVNATAIGTTAGPHHLARTIVDVFANREMTLAKAMTALVLEGEPPAKHPPHSLSPAPTYDPPPHPPPHTSQTKSNLIPPSSSPHPQSAADSRAIHPPPGPSLPVLRAAGALVRNMKGASTVMPALSHRTQEAVIRVPSNTPPPQLLVPMSPSPTPHPTGSSGTTAAYTYDQFSEFLRPAVQVLKKYYRQSRSGGPAQPVAPGSGPITVDPLSPWCSQIS